MSDRDPSTSRLRNSHKMADGLLSSSEWIRHPSAMTVRMLSERAIAGVVESLVKPIALIAVVTSRYRSAHNPVTIGAA